ncbi:hypothetical protein TanjilG_32043 [Lupinus angustifolius]|uniref:DUF4283 domain-containing protein n=1 Tax=Lupinus angustifolius TaxID=3871 RepID=A0A4P1RFM1_LUPAN|nr:hypothetical protein TanjilG_32043 [Lupinus angustifolius]
MRRRRPKSLLRMVLGYKKSSNPRIKIDPFQANLATIEFEDSNPQKPMVNIADSVFEGLYEPWQDALVVTLLIKTMGYYMMKDRLTRLWRLKVDFEIMDICNGYYMVKFEEEVDRTKVMDEGPWMIFDQYLTMLT